jgi:hypothetical protein
MHRRGTRPERVTTCCRGGEGHHNSLHGHHFAQINQQYPGTQVVCQSRRSEKVCYDRSGVTPADGARAGSGTPTAPMRKPIAGGC